MPPYAQQLGSLGNRLGSAGGGVAGGTAGGYLGHALSGLLEPLDYPRQALYNLFKGDPVAALPGLAGLLATGGLAATGVGLPAAIGLGALTGGALQGAGKELHPEQFKAAKPEDLAENLGFDKDNPVSSMLMGALTDPLTYAGGIGGLKQGAKAGGEALGSLGQKLGSRWAGIAEKMGPGFEGGASNILAPLHRANILSDPSVFPGSPLGQYRDLLSERVATIGKMRPGLLERIGSEIPPGSDILPRGIGAESIAMGTPQGGVAKLTLPEAGFTNQAPDLPEILQRARTAEIRGPGWRPERSPLEAMVSHEPQLVPGTGVDPVMADSAMRQLQASLQGQGVKWGDPAYRNIGFNPATKEASILDPSAMLTQQEPRGPWVNDVSKLPMQPSVAMGDEKPGTWLERTLLGPKFQRDIRAEIAAKTGMEPGALERFTNEAREAPTNLDRPAGIPAGRLERMVGGAGFEPAHGLPSPDPIQAQIDNLIQQGRIPDAASLSRMREQGLLEGAMTRQPMANEPGPETLERLMRGGEGGGASPGGMSPDVGGVPSQAAEDKLEQLFGLLRAKKQTAPRAGGGRLAELVGEGRLLHRGG